MAEGFGKFGDGEEKRVVQDKGLNRGRMEVAAAAGVVGGVMTVGTDGTGSICRGMIILCKNCMGGCRLGLQVEEAVGQGERTGAQHQKNAQKGNDAGAAKTGYETDTLTSH
jgi:hypothetical protein